MLADLIHHIRNDLQPDQLFKAVTLFSTIFHDPMHFSGIQTMCAKLLSNIAYGVVRIPNKDQGSLKSRLFILPLLI
jgi:transformation/transcription domain-associated protein